MTRSRTRADASSLCFFTALLLMPGGADAAPPADRPASPSRSPSLLEAEHRAAYPMSVQAASPPLAGVRLSRITIPGLHISARSENAPDEGGIVLSFSDHTGAVRAVVHLAVAADAGAARKVLDVELHGIAAQLEPSTDTTLGDVAWTDDSGRGSSLVVAALGNIAYSVSVPESAPGLPTAAGIARIVRAAMVAGTPSFPAVTVSLPSAIEARGSTPVSVTVPGGSPFKLRAEGGYIARGPDGPVVRPFGPGLVTVRATVTDDLGRVSVAAGTATAGSQTR